MPATVYQHPNAPVVFDPYPQTPEGIAAVKAQAEAARYEMPTAEQFELLAVQDGLYQVIKKYGGPRVMRWVRNLSAIAGEDIEDRPADRCLADGGALVNSICVQCGRDNS